MPRADGCSHPLQRALHEILKTVLIEYALICHFLKVTLVYYVLNRRAMDALMGDVIWTATINHVIATMGGPMKSTSLVLISSKDLAR